MTLVETTSREDLYPSRTPHLVPGWLRRQEPTVYPSDFEGPLSDGQLAFYDIHGFLCLEDWLDDASTEELKRESDRLGSSAQIDGERVVGEPDRNVIRSIFEPHATNQIINKLTKRPELAGAARQILGDKVYIHQSRLNFKPGFEGKAFDWHSDFETWHVEDGMPRMRALSCVVLIHENFIHNGPLMIVPGSHRVYLQCGGQTPENHYRQSLQKQQYGVPDRTQLKELMSQHGIHTMLGKPGTVILFDCNAMHGSAGNISPFPRNNLFVVFNAASNALVAPYCGLKPRPEHIASRSFQTL